MRDLTYKYDWIKKRMVMPLLVLVLTLSVAYVYFVNSAVIEIIAKNNNSTYLKSISSEYRELEAIYFDTINNIDLERAHSLGFVEQGKNDYVIRPVEVASR